MANMQKLLTGKITFLTQTKKTFFIFKFKLVETKLLFKLHLLTVRNFLALKGRMYCFSMQVVMNKCFLLNAGKKLA